MVTRELSDGLVFKSSFDKRVAFAIFNRHQKHVRKQAYELTKDYEAVPIIQTNFFIHIGRNISEIKGRDSDEWVDEFIVEEARKFNLERIEELKRNDLGVYAEFYKEVKVRFYSLTAEEQDLVVMYFMFGFSYPLISKMIIKPVEQVVDLIRQVTLRLRA